MPRSILSFFHSKVPCPNVRVLGRPCVLLRPNLTSRPPLWQVHKLPMLGKLFSFSGKSSLYRTGSARCSTTLRGIVPKTEANLLMHSDLWGLDRRKAGEQMSGRGVAGREKMSKRLTDENKVYNAEHQQRKSK